jgi:hypothetical protein
MRAVDQTESALLRAVRFLSDEVGFIHLKLVPNPLPLLILLSKFFYLHPHPAARTKTLLSRGLWRRFLGYTRMMLTDPASQAIDEIDQDQSASVERFLHRVSTSTWSSVAGGLRLMASLDSALYQQLAVLALAQLGSRDPETGNVISHEEIRAHLQTRTVRELCIDVAGEERTPIARRVLITNPDKLAKLPSASLEILASHGIDREAALALARGDLATFAARREEFLNACFHRYVSERVAFDDNDRPPVDDLIRRVDKTLAAE